MKFAMSDAITCLINLLHRRYFSIFKRSNLEFFYAIFFFVSLSFSCFISITIENLLLLSKDFLMICWTIYVERELSINVNMTMTINLAKNKVKENAITWTWTCSDETGKNIINDSSFDSSKWLIKNNISYLKIYI